MVEEGGVEWPGVEMDTKKRLRPGESNGKRVKRRKEFIIYCTEEGRGIRPGRNERIC